MIGYFKPFREELKLKEDRLYRHYYCGQCVSLRKEYGYLSSAMMSFESIFLSLLFSKDSDFTVKARCTVLPFVKLNIKISESIDIISSINQVFVLLKQLDSNVDKDKNRSILLKIYLLNKKRKLVKRLKEKDIDLNLIIQNYENSILKESDPSLNFEQYIADNVNSMEYIFKSIADFNKFDSSLFAEIGGKFYTILNLLDAIEDFHSDRIQRKFNPLGNTEESNRIFEIESLFYETHSALSKGIQKVNLNQSKQVLIDNILNYTLLEYFNDIMHSLKEKEVRDGKTKLLRYFRNL